VQLLGLIRLVITMNYCRLENNVGIFDAINAHLISFSRERDLQPIVLANCNYSLEVGQGTRVEYDFETMERQVEERFIRGRPRLIYQVCFSTSVSTTSNVKSFPSDRYSLIVIHRSQECSEGIPSYSIVTVH
jgi:hypothetical protein